MDEQEISIRNSKVGINRWKKDREKCEEHLKQATKDKQYLVMKSKLLGFLAGDGSVHLRKNKENKTTHHMIQFYPDHISIAETYITAFKFLYLKEPKIENKKNYYSIRISHPVAFFDLMKICNFGTYNWGVPFNFLKNKEMKIEWLKAFFDCEGSVLKNQIQIQSVNEKGIYQIKKLLERLKIESKVYKYKRKNPNWGINYILCIMKVESRKKFLNEIGFNHKIKLEKLKSTLASVPQSG